MNKTRLHREILKQQLMNYDYSNTPKTALIKIKDPNEYYQKLLSHNNLSSFKDYLN